MKQFRRIGKLLLLAVLICSMLALTACGTPKADAEDAGGSSGSVVWDYKKETHTLTVSGNGAIGNAASAAEVAWASVRTSVQKIVVNEGVTEIGDYAFYYMPALTEVRLPSTVTRIGKCAFAFCSSLAGISIPDHVTAVGESAFEACSALTSVSMKSCTSLGARAFAFCRSLEKVYIFGKLDSIGKWTFKDCGKLGELVINNEVKGKPCDPAAFEGSTMTLEKAQGTDSEDGSSTMTVLYQYEDGTTAAETQVGSGAYGSGYHFVSPAIEGYTPDRLSVSGTYGVTNEPVTVIYKSNAPAESETPSAPAETEPTEPEEPQSITWVTVVSVVIMVVVLAAIGVGAFLLARSDKKGTSQTVRKNGDGKKKKK